MSRTLTARLALVVCFFTALSMPATFAQASFFSSSSGVDESQTVPLRGNTHPLARAEFDRGAVPGMTRMARMVLLLQPDTQRQEELDALVKAQHDPSSALYRQWLTPGEYGQRFGARPGEIERITGWLSSHGFTVEPVSAGQRVIVFSGTAAQVTEAFHTEIHRFMVNGQQHIANDRDPEIPRELAMSIQGILSLHDFRRVPEIAKKRAVGSDAANPEYTSGSTNYLMPADYATIYDLNPLYSNEVNGTGVSIAIVGRSNINLSDVATFRSNAGLPANNPTVIVDGTNPGVSANADFDEATLDVEWSGAVAPDATVSFVVAESTASTDGADLAAQYIVDNDVAPVMSVSFGSCEADMGSSALSFYNSLWEQAASEGISAFVSSGDSGAAGCDAGSASKGTKAAVNGMCSSTYVTCVGGTEFNEGSGTYWNAANGTGGSSALSYIPEKVWNESASDGGSGLWAGGGGVSTVYAQPAWQTGIVPSTANSMRAVPDVSLTAAAHDGYMICENGGMYVVSGTSAASPSFAGIMALVVQKLGGSGLGNANSTLYALANSATNPFHATPSGNNSVPGVAGYTASSAVYNLATGLGSVDANVLVTNWPAQGTVVAQKGIALTPSTASISVFRTQSATFTVSVTGTAGYSGKVTLQVTAPSGFTASISPASVSTGGTATVTLTPTASETAASASLVVTGTSGAHTRTLSEPITVETPSLTVTPSVSSLSAFQTQPVTFTVATGASTGFTNTIALKATAPTGVTVSFSPANVKPGATATATVTASSTSTPGSGTIVVTGTAGGATQTASVGSTVVQPSLAVTPSVSSLSVFQTQPATFTVTASATSGYTGLITLKAAAPSGVTVSFSPTSIKPGATATATVTASSTSTPGSGTITLTGTSGSATATASVTATVAKPTIAVTSSVSSLSVFQTQPATFTVTASATSGYTEPIALKATEPTGVTISFSPTSIKPGATATATVTASSTSTPGTGTITLTGTSGSATTTASVTTTVAKPTITLTPSATSLSVAKAATATLTVAASATSGYTEAVTLKATAPTGVTVSFIPASVKPGASATAKITVAQTASSGTASVTITGTSGNATTTSALTVTIP